MQLSLSDRQRGSRFLQTVLLLALFALPASGQVAPGWRKVEIPATGSYLLRYVPPALDTTKPVPLVLFFHGSNGTPEDYKPFVATAAEMAGCVVAMPKSFSNIGWGVGNDEQTTAETLRLVRAEIPVDDRRVALAGHSAGGAWAYLTAYSGSAYSAVFTLSAPFYPVASLADSGYKPPIHMYYGTTDLNYTGARPSLETQWARLGVPWEEDVQAGFGHNTWPVSSMADGFRFVVEKSRPDPAALCTPTATSFCLSRGRFRVEVAWDANGSSGPGHTVPSASADSGLFWFFASDNWEVMVKVLDGCGVNGRYWIFAAGTTNVHYVLTVTDTATGSVKLYENPVGKAAAAVTDVDAFQTCP
jgi:pimeloyl-ACP methyl ester carboxylesterase